MRILIADDESTHRRLLEVALEGHINKDEIFFMAETGAEAIKMARNYQPDIILMDVVMPEMDGFTALEKMKEDEATAHIPVIMITAAYVRGQDMERSRELGAADHIKKPFDIAGLREKVKKYAKKKAWGLDPGSRNPNLRRKEPLMSKRSVPQVSQEVKCGIEGCHEDIFRQGLCFDDFVEEQTAAWDDRDAERQTALKGVGYVFSDPVGEVMT